MRRCLRCWCICRRSSPTHRGLLRRRVDQMFCSLLRWIEWRSDALTNSTHRASPMQRGRFCWRIGQAHHCLWCWREWWSAAWASSSRKNWPTRRWRLRQLDDWILSARDAQVYPRRPGTVGSRDPRCSHPSPSPGGVQVDEPMLLQAVLELAQRASRRSASAHDPLSDLDLLFSATPKARR